MKQVHLKRSKKLGDVIILQPKAAVLRRPAFSQTTNQCNGIYGQQITGSKKLGKLFSLHEKVKIAEGNANVKPSNLPMTFAVLYQVQTNLVLDSLGTEAS